MNLNQYNHYCEIHGLPTMDEKLETAGVVTTNPVSIFALENTLIALVGQDKARRIETGIFATCPTHAQQIAALQAAIAEAQRTEDLIEALKAESTVTTENGFSQQQEEQTIEQTSRARRASRTGRPFPRRDMSGLQGLFPNAYSEKQDRELSEARAFFA